MAALASKSPQTLTFENICEALKGARAEQASGTPRLGEDAGEDAGAQPRRVSDNTVTAKDAYLSKAESLLALALGCSRGGGGRGF